MCSREGELMNVFPQGLRHGKEGREGESQAEPRALCLQGAASHEGARG